jgi:hypothetical protein
MKAIFAGKRYDTETAEELASWQNTTQIGDFSAEGFTIYRTKNGNYFRHAWGGPMSSLGRKVGNEYHNYDGIVPLAPDEAREDLEQCGRDGLDALERYFPVEDA